MMTDQKYKDMSIKEFTKAAEIYDSGHAGLYEICKDDYPPVLDELKEFPDRSYTGIDLTPRMIEVAQEKIKDDGDKSEVEVV